MAALHEQKNALEDALAVCSTSGDAKELVKLNKRYTQLQQEIAEAEAAFEASLLQL